MAQSGQNSGLTHSRTLMPMVRDLLKNAGHTLQEVDVIAVAAGPGSFTGIRIGVAAAKGLAWGVEKPAVMDARRQQVYNARFQGTGEGLLRLCPDRAISLADLGEELKNSQKPQILVGDGAVLCYTELKELGLDLRLAPPHLRFQSAWGVAREALELARAGRLTDAAGLTPDYHRLSQAERERLELQKQRGITP